MDTVGCACCRNLMHPGFSCSWNCTFDSRNSPKFLALHGTTKPGLLPPSLSRFLSIPGNGDEPRSEAQTARKRNLMEFGSLLLPKLAENWQLPLCQHLWRMGMKPSFLWWECSGHGFIAIQSFQSHPVKESTTLSAIFYIKYIYLYIKNRELPFLECKETRG